jgi:hypothetical protein
MRMAMITASREIPLCSPAQLVDVIPPNHQSDALIGGLANPGKSGPPSVRNADAALLP